MRNQLLKRLLLIFMALSLVLALVPAVSFAQEATEEAHAESEETHSETGAEGEEAHSEEAAEEAGGLAALGINTGFLFGQIINIGILFLLLGSLLWRPAVNMLNSRSAKIQKGLEDAAAAARARQNAEAEADKILAEARAERQKVIEEARLQGEDVKKSIESEARQDAERIRRDANAEAEGIKSNALAGVRDDVLKISSAVAGQILKENIDAKKNSALISNFFTRLPEAAKNLSGNVEIISAMPLTDDEKKKVEGALKGSSYSYTVDASLLGGLIVRSQDKVIDGSVRGGLSDVTGRMK
jgi:F-type H+-transporting ATPase subunit b